MEDNEVLKKKLQNALRLCGFNVRREFCSLIVDKFTENSVDLYDINSFETCINSLSSSLESECLAEQSIERKHIDQALELCLHSGYDKHETILSIINAFDFPRFSYNIDRKQYFPETKKSRLLSNAISKSELFLNRYETVLQRTKRNFKTKANEIKLQTVDYLLTLSHVSLKQTLILGCLLQGSGGKYYLEDPTGLVLLDLTHVRYYGGFFVENMLVLINGIYEDKMLKASTIILPPGEEYCNSKPSFGHFNYFGGPSSTPLRDSVRLRQHLQNNPDDLIMFFSNLWLDHLLTFEKLEALFDGLENSPPTAFVFMGNFISESFTNEKMDILKKLFKRLADLIQNYPNLMRDSHFIFVPGMEDPCPSNLVPRFPLPSSITDEITKTVKKSIFTTNPCRIQYCTREIVVFRGDILPKLLQASLHKPIKVEIADYVTRTLISQGHLSPLPLNSLTVHWDFDYTLHLYPLPDLVVVGDKAETYKGAHKECQVVNPGSFCENGFQFKAYTPSSGEIEDCVL